MRLDYKKQLILSAVIAAVIIATIALVLILRGDAKPADTDVSSDNISSVTSEISSEQTSSDEQSSESVSSMTSSEPEKIKLDVTAPKEDVTVYTDSVIIKGSADPSLPLYINDEEIEVDENGLFLEKKTLEVGNNWFTVKQGEFEYKCVVRYRKTVIFEVEPSKNLTVDGGSTLTVRVRALADSTVTATFNGKKLTLSEEPVEKQEEYSDYYGKFEMPINYEKDISYGKISFKAVSPSGTGSSSSGNITVKKSKRPEEQNYYMPTGGNYIDVGHTYVAEVVCRSAETFNANDTVDHSRPTNNYLPKGTVDYCSYHTNKIGSYELKTLRYGKQLYLETEGAGQNIKVYKGQLPDRNKVNIASFSSDGRHSTLTLDVDWKAPFNLDFHPQKYTSDGNSNLSYTLKPTDASFTYMDIDFCYAEELSGEIDLTDNKIFKSYEIIKNESDYTLRLHLKKKGMFYGWSAEYNEQGQLVFSFLNPATLVEADNEYGYSLEGITILIDAGHGGSQSGTDGFVSGNYEKKYTLLLAKKLQTRLEALGATVIMTRTEDVTVEAIDRMELLRDTKPDFAISIHRNASSSSEPRAFISYHFNAFSANAAKHIYNETENYSDEEGGLYKVTKWSGVKWHYFFLARCTECPSVLTENGFMTNKEEYYQITDDGFNERCANAFVDGIFAYFKSIQ